MPRRYTDRDEETLKRELQGWTDDDTAWIDAQYRLTTDCACGCGRTRSEIYDEEE